MSDINELVLYEFNVLGGALGASARIAGTKAAEWGLGAMATNAAAQGATGVASGASALIPGIGSVIGGGLGAYQQHNINQLRDEYDRLRGIQPNSSAIGNTIKTAASGLLGAVPGVGLITNIVQGARLRSMQNKVEDYKNKLGYRNLQSGTQPLPAGGM